MTIKTRKTAEIRSIIDERQERGTVSIAGQQQREQFSPEAKPWDGRQNSVELRQERARTLDQLRAATSTAEKESRNLHKEEADHFDRLERRYQDLTRGITEAEESERREADTARSLRDSSLPGGALTDPNGRQERAQGPARLTATQSLVEHYRSRGQYNEQEAALSFDGFVRGMAGRGWQGYDAEKRALSGLSDPSGGILLPHSVSTSIIDLARAKSVVTQAGAQTVPMATREVTVPRLESDMTLEWMPELATQSESSNTFGAMTLKARTVRALAVLSEEIVEDVDNLEGFVSQAVAAAIAAEIDRVALFGDPAGSGQAEEPTGLLKTAGVAIVAAPATGTPTWADLVRSQTIVRNANHEPSAVISNPLAEEFLALQTDQSGQFIRPPSAVEQLARLTTSKVPVTADKSHLIMGDFKRLVIGWRSQIKVKVSEEYAMDRNAVTLLVTARVDIGVERTNAFHVREINTVEI